MNRSQHELDIAKRMKVIEWLKTELLDQVSSLFRALLNGTEDKIKDGLSSLIVSIYVLGRRLGLNYRNLDQAVIEKLQQHQKQGHQIEEWYGDLSELEDYINKR